MIFNIFSCVFFFIEVILGLHTTNGLPTSNLGFVNASEDALKEFASLFFMPVQMPTPNQILLNFRIQYPLIREDFYSRVRGSVEASNILEKIKNSRETPFILEEEEIASNTTQQNILRPNFNIMKTMMENIFDLPHHEFTHSKNREFIGGYIYQKFVRSGLLVATQDFTHQLPIGNFAKSKGSNQRVSNVEINGTNIIGVFPGKNWNTLFDKPIIVGAHWDVVANTTGFNDNGSGMAALLETVRVIMSAKCFKPANTIIFVAFDSEESGSAGSYEYVRRQIVPYFIRRGMKISGAIILDTLMNHDLERNSQNVPDAWKQVLPKISDSIQEDQNKGNFVAIIGRGSIQESRIMNVFSNWFGLVTKGINARRVIFDFKAYNFVLKDLPHDKFPTEETLLNYSSFWRSDNARFWYYRESENGLNFKESYDRAETISLPAILISDTAYNRGYMRQCYHKKCDNFNRENVTNVDYKFLTTITEAVILTVMDLSASGRVSTTALGGCNFSLDKDRIDNNVYDDENIEANDVNEKKDVNATSVKKKDNLPVKDNKINEVDTGASHRTKFNIPSLQTKNTQSIEEYDQETAETQNDVNNNEFEYKTKKKVPVLYSSGGGTQINIDHLNIAISASTEDLRPYHLLKRKAPYYGNFIPQDSSKDQIYTNIVDYLSKKLYGLNSLEDSQKQEDEENRNRRADIKNVERKRKNSPMIVHILDQTSDAANSSFNEITDN